MQTYKKIGENPSVYLYKKLFRGIIDDFFDLFINRPNRPNIAKGEGR
jgi:hypothetical protein